MLKVASDFIVKQAKLLVRVFHLKIMYGLDTEISGIDSRKFVKSVNTIKMRNVVCHSFLLSACLT